MSLRRSHNKSRSGCVACKHRHVKCDEKWPVCSQCERRSLHCETPLTIVNERAQKNVVQLGKKAQLSSSLIDINLLHTELILQWVNSTAALLSWSEAVSHIWKVVVPQQALNHPFLMRGMLAMSALHISRTVPEKKDYLKYAVEFQEGTLTLFRSFLAKVDQSNFIVVFTFGGIVQSTQMALSLPNSTANAMIDAYLEVIYLLKRTTQMLGGVFQWLEKSDYKALLDIGLPAETLPLEIQRFISSLHELGQKSESDRQVYEKTIGLLGQAFSYRNPERNTYYIHAMWCTFVPAEYLDLVKRRDPITLVILAYVGVLLFYCKNTWWMDEWGINLVSAVHELLDESWKGSLKWALAEVGLGNLKE